MGLGDVSLRPLGLDCAVRLDLGAANAVAPAWVSWREGAGYVGWAPLPPAARISVSGSIEGGETVIAPRFVYVEERHLLEPVRPTTVIVNNTTVINKTVNITKIKIVNKTVVNEGPRTEIVGGQADEGLKRFPPTNSAIVRKPKLPPAGRTTRQRATTGTFRLRPATSASRSKPSAARRPGIQRTRRRGQTTGAPGDRYQGGRSR